MFTLVLHTARTGLKKRRRNGVSLRGWRHGLMFEAVTQTQLSGLEMQRWTNENLALWLKSKLPTVSEDPVRKWRSFPTAVQCVMTKSMFWCQSHACKWRVSFQNHTSVFISDVNFQLSYVINSPQPDPWSQYRDLKWNPSIFHIPIMLKKIPIKQCCSLMSLHDTHPQQSWDGDECEMMMHSTVDNQPWADWGEGRGQEAELCDLYKSLCVCFHLGWMDILCISECWLSTPS